MGHCQVYQNPLVSSVYFHYGLNMKYQIHVFVLFLLKLGDPLLVLSYTAVDTSEVGSTWRRQVTGGSSRVLNENRK